MKPALNDRALRSLKPRDKLYEVGDGKVQGLSLRVLPSGAKRWSFRWRAGNQYGRIALGPFPSIGLADARDIATEHLRAVKKGRNPSDEKREQREAETFDVLAKRFIEEHSKGFIEEHSKGQKSTPNKRTWRDDERKLEREIPKSWRKRLPSEITRRDVRAVIARKAVTAPIQANRLRALLHKLFNFAIEQEMIEFNPVTGTPRPGVEHQRQRVLSEDEIRAFWEATEPGDAKDSMSKAMSAFWRLRLITGQRSSEVSTILWSDLDLDNAMWTIPEEHSKNRLTHRVPLSEMALEIIEGLPHHEGLPRHKDFVLVGARGKRQQAAAARQLDLEDFTGHDLRRTAASFMASAGIPRLHIGKVLNHAERGVTAVYDRHSYDPEKRVALDTWARKLRSIVDRSEGAKVVPITRK